LEYFISTHGARKGLADTALRTADSGYLTRRLVDVAQDVIIREEDCGTASGITVGDITVGKETIEPISDRIVGRRAAEDVRNPENSRDKLVKRDEEIDEEKAKAIIAAGIKTVKIRSVLVCQAKHGVCAMCYGRNLATGLKVDIGEAVGIIAAQSIGEPGTQLTLRTFHTGGVAAEDIITGLPRVEELFEARKPKGQAIITEESGTAHIQEERGIREVVITDAEGEEHIYEIPFNVHLTVHDGDHVEAGDQLCEGSVNPHDILRIKGETALQNYLVQEVQKVYRSQGVDINDKHIEVIVRSMLRKKKVTDPGDTTLLPGQMLDNEKFVEVNGKVAADGRTPAQADTVLLGVTKASLATESFLSAASFQETTRVLTQAAIEGKYDPLLGLKENVIIGKLIPAGTGMPKYRQVDVWGKGQPRFREVDIFGEPEMPEATEATDQDNAFARAAELAASIAVSEPAPIFQEPPVGAPTDGEPRNGSPDIERPVSEDVELPAIEDSALPVVEPVELPAVQDEALPAVEETALPAVEDEHDTALAVETPPVSELDM
ncbi:MAG: hypothetical protein JO293_01565, partial [Candidatus Eremiobacteraeota bacterium]|nr:hypothetical protein [Candidatus Eremiobacteraeota bacterium]